MRVSLSADWPEPVPFGGRDLPRFPVDVLPPTLAEYVHAVAAHTQTPPDLAAMLALSVVSLAVAGRAEVHASHRESLSLYTVTAMRPGTRKSAVFRLLCSPLLEYESEVRQREKPDIQAARSKLRVLEGTRARLEQKAASSRLTPEERTELEGVVAEIATAPPAVPFRLLADDATPEQLATLLAEQGGALGVFSEEGAGPFDLMAGKYSASRVPSFEVFLRGHDGGALRIDRRGREEDVPRAVLSLGLAIQPGALATLTRHAGMRARGLCGRFLYALPADTLGMRSADAPCIEPTVRAEYRALVLRLLAGSEVRGRTREPVTLELDRPAANAERDFRAWLEPMLREHGSLGWLTDWAGKLAGAVLRVAGLLHVADWGSIAEAKARPISAGTVGRAVRIAHYLIPHAKAAFEQMDADPETGAARRVLGWIRDRGLTRFTRAEAAEGLRGWLPSAAAVNAPLAMLEARGYIRRLETPPREPGRAGRPPGPAFEVHPCVAASNAGNATNPPAFGDYPDSPDFSGDAPAVGGGA